MPATKLARKFKRPDLAWFKYRCKAKMIEQDTWYQDLERTKRITRGAAAVRGWVEDPGRFRLDDMIEYLTAINFTPEEIGEILKRLATEMAGGKIHV
jgi:hypothetical protein